MTSLGLSTYPGRCSDGFDLKTQHPGLCKCAEAEAKVTGNEWSIFLGAIRKVAAENAGEVDANKVRPLVRGRMEPKHIGTAFAQAKRMRLIERVGINESTDAEGKNAGRPQPLYRLRSAA